MRYIYIRFFAFRGNESRLDAAMWLASNLGGEKARGTNTIIKVRKKCAARHVPTKGR